MKLNRKGYEPYLYIGPSVALILFIYVYPIFEVIRMSFVRVGGGRESYVGLFNYALMVKDDAFWQAIRNNCKLVLVVPVIIFISLILAVFLYERVKGWQLYRVLLFVPYIVPIAVVGLVFGFIFEKYGIANTMLRGLGLGFLAKDWLGKSTLAFPVVTLTIVWKEFGFGVALFLARLMTAREDLYDAAKIDGANWWQILFHVTIPQLLPTIVFFTLIEIIGMLSFVFAYIYVMTAGGPGKATYVLEFYIYQNAFRFSRPGLGYAASVVLFLITLVLVYFQHRVMRRAVEQLE